MCEQRANDVDRTVSDAPAERTDIGCLLVAGAGTGLEQHIQRFGTPGHNECRVRMRGTRRVCALTTREELLCQLQ